MSLPKFITTVEDLDSPVDTIFNDFTSQISLEDLYLAAESHLRERIPHSNVYTFREMPGGMMGHIIDLILLEPRAPTTASQFSDLQVRLMDHYGFTQESLPPRMLIREAVALRVRLGAVLSDIERDSPDVSRVGLVYEIGKAARQLALPSDAYTLSDETANGILSRA